MKAALDVNEKLSNGIALYIQKYLSHNKLDLKAAFAIYDQFIKTYNKDMDAFAQTGKYPPELEGAPRSMKRVDYDVVLLLSVILSPHRYQMMNLIVSRSTAAVAPESRKALFIGCGPALEMSLLDGLYGEMHAFDISLNPQLREFFPQAHFYQELFPSDSVQFKFDAIYMIELLEHLEDPYALLADCAKYLTPTGQLHLTTATDIPQFDHLYNFEADHKRFEERVTDLKLVIASCDEIKHDYIMQESSSKNRYYVLAKG